MKITAIETVRTFEFPNLLWVRVVTDEGLVGLGADRSPITGTTHAPRHDCTGPVALTVSTHLALNAGNCWVQEMVRAPYFGLYDRFVTQLPPLLKGEITILDGPGLGLQLQPDIAARPGAGVRRTTAMDHS